MLSPTEGVNQASVDLDLMSPLEIVALMDRESQRAVESVRAIEKETARAVEAIRDAFLSGGRLIYIGAGTSGRLGVLDASECPPTFSTDPAMVLGFIAGGDAALRRASESAEDDPVAGARVMKEAAVGPKDVVCGITASGRTPYVQGALREARSRGAKTVFVTCNPGSPFNAEVDIPLAADTGPEILSGSTRLKAGTATKLLLNTLTTAAMILSGKVYSNRMVDLSPGCFKLVDRGRRIVMDLLGVDEARATQLLEGSGGRVKVALLMGSAGIDRAEAESRLERAGGFLRRAVPGGKLR